MLRVNVGLSRKLSKDYNSTGYSINVEGEVRSPITDPEAVTEEVKQLYDLAEEALGLQIDRSQGEAAIASRDAGPARAPRSTDNGNRSNGNGDNGNRSNGSRTTTSGEPATNKQIQYMLTLGKRQRLSTVELEHRIEEVVGEQVGIYDLTKRQAAVVIDDLAGENGRATSRSGR